MSYSITVPKEVFQCLACGVIVLVRKGVSQTKTETHRFVLSQFELHRHSFPSDKTAGTAVTAAKCGENVGSK
jgi:hypothetical protein